MSSQFCDPPTSRRTLAALSVLLTAALGLVQVGCKPHADHWIVIATPELQAGCNLQDPLPSAPACLEVDKGSEVGFANFSETEVTVEVNPSDTFSGVTGSFKLQHGDWKVLTVAREDIKPLITFEATTPPPHGGPTMIVNPGSGP